jgi:hypothetical protein
MVASGGLNTYIWAISYHPYWSYSHRPLGILIGDGLPAAGRNA